MSKYQIIGNEESKKAIFDTETGQQISQWWQTIHTAIENPEYYIVINDENQYAIFHISNPYEPISQWWQNINAVNLLKNQSEYYIAQNSKKQWAIFYINNPHQPISQWWDEIEKDGLLKGQSDYYMVKRNLKHAIFHKDNPDTPITPWWDWITPSGFLQGQSDYYIAYSNEQKAIFHKDDPDRPISQWWNNIYGDGILKNKSEYYMARNKDKYAIFHIFDRNKPISDWHNYIFPLGLINNTSEYYATYDYNNSIVQIYHCANKTQPLYELPNVYKNGLLYLTDDFALYLTNKHLMMYDMRKMQHYVISKLPKDMTTVLNRKYQGNTQCNIDTDIIYASMNAIAINDFIPFIVIIEHEKTIDWHIYLFTTQGQYAGKFKDLLAMFDYIDQQLSSQQHNKHGNMDIMRLY